ncbi:hypothetical protein RJ55_06973 [Drechmeria coniospora]|nr:hypothetical protein RJ55_06973 [Drechmeria coniospora]
MLRKKDVFTVVTPIPGFIPRQLAIDILHAHSEVITLNPLVLEHRPIPAPRDAAADEYYSTWYEIVERIQYIPGLGKAGSGLITFTGCFHDMPWGLQTHTIIKAPMNVDLRNKYRIAGNQPGIELPEAREIGLEALGAPADGLYLREDIEIKCNIAMVGFVKTQLKAASREMVQRIIKKAELLDAGVLHAMMENGKLKTYNPNDRSKFGPRRANSNMLPNPNADPWPQDVYVSGPTSPRMPSPFDRASEPYYAPTSYQQPSSEHSTPPPPAPAPVPPPPAPKDEPRVAPVELPGDWQHYQPPLQDKRLPRPASDNPSSLGSSYGAASSDPRWSQPPLSRVLPDTTRTSFQSVASSGGNHSAMHPFASELAAHREIKE